MNVSEIQNVTVLGAGIMGHGIAQGFLMGGLPVRLFDIKQDALDVARAHVVESLEFFREAGLLTPAELRGCSDRLTTTMDLTSAVQGSDFVIEVVPEIMEVKQDVLLQVETYSRPDTIIASNTSHLDLSEVFATVKKKDRTIGAHYFNPPQIVPTVEVIKAEGSSDETLETTYALMKKIRKAPVKIQKAVPGFVVNRLQTALLREAFWLVENGVATAEDIDAAVKGSLGFRSASIGPLRMVDLGGVDAWADCCEKLLPDMENTRKPARIITDLVEQGNIGIRSGKGFYEYAVNFSQKDLDAAIQERDREFLERLKHLYWKSSKAEAAA